MKKCLGISLLLFVCTFGSMGCRQLRDFRKPGLETQETTTPGFEWIDEGQNQQVTTTQSVPVLETIPDETSGSSIDKMPTSTLTPALVSVNEFGSSVVSRVYPWDECGIVRLDKVMPKEIELNQQFSYTITITNLTDSFLSGIVINEEYPNNFELISTNPTAQEGLNKLSWEIDSLGPKAERKITVSGMADYAEPLKCCTTVQTPVIPACSSIEVIQPSLKLVKHIPDNAMLCDLIPVKYIITNDGTGTVSQIRINETLPSGLRTTDGRGEITIEVGSLPENQSREYTIELRAARVGTYSGKAIASSVATGLRSESAETTTVVSQPVLGITKLGPNRLYIGRPVTYEVTVTNKSDVTAKDVVIEDTIPTGVDSIRATNGAQLTEQNTKLTWKLDTLAPNSSETFRISYTPTKPGTITNGATATAYCAQAVSASMKTVVTGIPAIMLEVGDLEDPVRIGERATYMITVTNQGSATATNIRIVCTLEDNVKYISSAGATSGTIEGSTIRFLPLGSLDPQEKAVWRIVVVAQTPGDVRFKAIMNSDELSRPVEETEATHLYE